MVRVLLVCWLFVSAWGAPCEVTPAPCSTTTTEATTTADPCPSTTTAAPCAITEATTTTTSPPPCVTTTTTASPCQSTPTTTVSPCNGPATTATPAFDSQPEVVIDRGVCSNGWTSFKDSCYFVSREDKGSLKEAEEDCKSQEAMLFVANSEEEYKAIYDTVPFNTWTWLGLRKAVDEEKPRWQLTDGMDHENLNWLIKPYNDVSNGWSAAAECAAQWNPSTGSGDYSFYYPCDYKFHYVCERNSTA